MSEHRFVAQQPLGPEDLRGDGPDRPDRADRADRSPRGRDRRRGLRVLPRAGFECEANEAGGDPAAEIHIPKLFRIYLRFGARVCGPPAIDRLFQTIDFLVLFDMEEMGGPWRNLFFGA